MKTTNGLFLNAVTIFISFITFGCSNESAPENEILTGELIGYVYHKPFSQTIENVSISIEDEDSQIKVTTDFEGKFIVSNLPTGTYNLTFKKEGFFQHKVLGHQFKPDVSSTLTFYTALTELVDFDIENLTLSNTNDFFYPGYIDVNLNITNYTGLYSPSIRYFMSDNPNVSYENYITTENITLSLLGNQWFRFLGDTRFYPSGTKMYLIAYPSSRFSLYYIDIDTGLKIYTSILNDRPSNVKSITIE